MKYLVIYERSTDGGWGAYVPDLPGCFTLADTREQANRLIHQAIAGHLEVMRERGDPITEPTIVAADLIEVT